ncbi:MAG: transposase [Sciscionella sp.]
MIPEPTPAKGPGGRPRVDDRSAREGILFVLTTGCRWRDVPRPVAGGRG